MSFHDKSSEGVVASTLPLLRNGALGFIDWLDLLEDSSRLPEMILSMINAKISQTPPYALGEFYQRFYARATRLVSRNRVLEIFRFVIEVCCGNQCSIIL
jgi:hypothetical protein